MGHRRAGAKHRRRLERERNKRNAVIKDHSPVDLDDPNTIIYYGVRHNELGQVEILGRKDDQYLCVITKDGVAEVRWLNEEQVK